MELVMDDELVKLWRGDCREVMAQMDDNSVDSIVTDPPYELGFMGRGWDSSGIAFDPEVWAQALRVLKPGGHALVFGGTRTWHRVAVALEDAGFEIRDSLAWMYSSGFPKSMNVSKAIDKAAGALAHESVGFTVAGRTDKNLPNPVVKGYIPPAPATPDAERWQGWGTALKPAFEPVIVARKPLIGTVAANVLTHGTGALNIDATRISTTDSLGGGANKGMTAETRHEGFARPWMRDDEAREAAAARSRENTARAESMGRWPANVLLDQHAAAWLDEQSGASASKRSARGAGKKASATYGAWGMADDDTRGHDDSGGASRFFYCAKAPSSERPNVDGVQHATVKPLDVMRWLVRLVTPPGGTVLEPFAGSGTTLEAAILEGFSCIGIELDEDGTHIPLIMQRLRKPLTPAMF